MGGVVVPVATGRPWPVVVSVTVVVVLPSELCTTIGVEDQCPSTRVPLSATTVVAVLITVVAVEVTPADVEVATVVVSTVLVVTPAVVVVVGGAVVVLVLSARWVKSTTELTVVAVTTVVVIWSGKLVL